MLPMPQCKHRCPNGNVKSKRIWCVRSWVVNVCVCVCVCNVWLFVILGEVFHNHILFTDITWEGTCHVRRNLSREGRLPSAEGHIAPASLMGGWLAEGHIAPCYCALHARKDLAAWDCVQWLCNLDTTWFTNRTQRNKLNNDVLQHWKMELEREEFFSRPRNHPVGRWFLEV